jgi:WD40 repeat protein
MALAPNGDLALTATADTLGPGDRGAIVNVWDLRDGVLLQSWRYSYPLKNMLVTPDSRNVVCVLDVAGDNGTSGTRLSFRNLPDGEPLRELEAEVPIWHLAVSRDGKRAISANFHGLFVVWNLESGEIAGSVLSEAGIWQLGMSWDGRRALVAHFRRMPLSKVAEDAADLYRRQVRSTGDPFYEQLDLLQQEGSADDSSAEFDNAISVFDLDARNGFRILRAHFDKIDVLTGHPDNVRAVSASWDGTIKVWNMETGATLQTLSAHSGKATHVAIVPDGSRAVSCGTDHAIRVWDLSRAAETSPAKAHHGAVTGVAITPDGRRAISGSLDGSLVEWNTITGEPVASGKVHADAMTAVVLASDGKHVVSAGADGSLCVGDLESQMLIPLDGHEGSITALVVVEPDRVASAGADGAVKLWDWTSGAELYSLQVGSIDSMLNRIDPVTAIAGAPDTRWLLCVTYQFNPDFGKGFRKVLLCDLGGDAPARTLDSSFAYWRYSDAICFVPVRELGAFATDRGEIGIWDAANGYPMPSLPGHPGGVVKLAASRDGRHLVSAGVDGTVTIWNLDTGSPHCEMKVDAPVTSLCFSAGDQRVVACTTDGAVVIWSCMGGELIARFQGEGEIGCCALSSDGTRLLAGESTGQVHILQLRE